MNKRISTAFAKAKAESRGAFVAYLTMGFPSLARQVMDEHIDFCEANCLNHRAFSKMKENQF